MPTYDYECKKCGHEEERFEPMSASAPKRCPACKAPRSFTRRIGVGAGIIFRGSGFYETDYKRKGANGKAAERAPESTPAPSAASEPKKDAAAPAAAAAGGKTAGGTKTGTAED
ncbi:MAG TPA: FmdB family transcriptional regulator [Planctomycetes bacterium]|nr:FmdB family transcriptional regulator [Planctomycetota bacterium]